MVAVDRVVGNDLDYALTTLTRQVVVLVLILVALLATRLALMLGAVALVWIASALILIAAGVTAHNVYRLIRGPRGR